MKRQLVSARLATFGAVTLVIVGAGLRWGFNDVRRFGNGDEYHYRLQAEAIFRRGWSYFPELVRWHLANEPDFPAPYRWGILLAGKLACTARQICDERSLAWVSTVSGMLVVLFVALLARKLFSLRTALVATALAITSPLHLELGRRAYLDELHTALLLSSMLALAYFADDVSGPKGERRRGMALILSILSLTLAWSVKESVAFMLPALGIWLWGLRSPPTLRWRDALILFAPAGLALLGFGVINHGFSGLVALVEATRHSLRHPYSIAFQAGPPHRSLVELFTLSPGVFATLPVVAFVAFGIVRPIVRPSEAQSEIDRGRATVLCATFLFLFAAFMLLPKNLRFCAVLDPVARLLVAWLLCEALPLGNAENAGWCISILLANSAFELAVFHRTFVVSAVTDPTASAIFGALQMIPSQTRPWHPPLLVTACGLCSTMLAWVAAVKWSFSRKAILGASLISLGAIVGPRLLKPERVLVDGARERPAFDASRSMQAPPLEVGGLP